jgi:hypothetical protein
MPLSSQIALVPTMPPQVRPSTLRIRTAKLGDRSMSICSRYCLQQIPATLTWPPLGSPSGIFPGPPRRTRSAGGLRLLPSSRQANRPALRRRRSYPTTLQSGKNSGGGHEIRRAPTAVFNTQRAQVAAVASGQRDQPLDRGREGRLSTRLPLPPNRTCGSPASGSPVGGFTSERIDGPEHGP